MEQKAYWKDKRLLLIGKYLKNSLAKYINYPTGLKFCLQVI